MKNLVTFITIFFCSASVYSQVSWEKCYGGTDLDEIVDIKLTSDGGMILIGDTQSNDGDVTGFHEGNLKYAVDAWICKLDAAGNLQWQKSLGGFVVDYGNEIQQTSDGGYIIAATTYSIDGDIAGRTNQKHSDGWVVKFDPSGNIEWQKSLGGSEDDLLLVVVQTDDGGYMIAGENSSKEYSAGAGHGKTDWWLVRMDPSGKVLWEKFYGGSGIERLQTMIKVEGGYLLGGNTNSNDGDVHGNHSNSDDAWVVCVDESGKMLWQKCFGGNSPDVFYEIIETEDHGYLAVGNTCSDEGDATNNHIDVSINALTLDAWAVKFDHNGNVQWHRNLGGIGEDEFYDVIEVPGKGYVMIGNSSSSDGDLVHNFGKTDIWLLEMNLSGKILRQKIFGGLSLEKGRHILATPNGQYLIAGSLSSADGKYAKINHGNFDYWVLMAELDELFK